ncbi:MAG: hypothetical protein PVI78_02545 [Anaerolineales bacterium]
MSRKPRKRKKRKERTPNLPEIVTTRAGAKKATPIVKAAKQNNFNPDYSFVVKDLRRIGILAGSFIVILIVLSIVLN